MIVIIIWFKTEQLLMNDKTLIILSMTIHLTALTYSLSQNEVSQHRIMSHHSHNAKKHNTDNLYILPMIRYQYKFTLPNIYEH